MTESDNPTTEPDPLEREALAWVHRLVSGEASVAELEDAKRWRRISPAHAAAFAQAAHLWNKLGPAGRNVLQRQGAMRLPAQSLSRRRLLLGGAVAASAAAAAGLAFSPPLGLWPSLSESLADYHTRVGEQRRVAIADGVSATLNTATSLNVRSVGKEAMQIELVAGEAVLDSGVSRTVVVVAGDGRVRAGPARFNIRRDGRAACVSCLAGEVTVERQNAAVTLLARQQVAYAGDGLGTILAADPAIVSAWQDGVLVFHGTPLVEVVAEINRYRPGRIVLLNEKLGRQPVNARFRVDHVDEMMTLVRRVFGAEVRSLPGGLVVLS